MNVAGVVQNPFRAFKKNVRSCVAIANYCPFFVSPDQIEAAQSSGKAGVETRPGTVAVRAIRREDADILPFKWLGYGLVAGFFVVYSTRKPKAAPKA